MTMQTHRIHIVGMGASTPIGQSVWASVAAARAGICGFSEHPFMIDTAGEPMCVARAPWLGVDVDGSDRFCELLFPAMDEALKALLEKFPQPAFSIGHCLALPPPRPGQPQDLGKRVLEAVNRRYANLISKSLLFPVGHAGGYLALDTAMKGIWHHSIDAWVVSGVDSYMAPETLEWVETSDQLHGAGPFNNAWGFIPGEAAGAIVVTTATHARRFRLDSFGEVLNIGLGRETKLIKTDAVCIGEGLTNAFRSALGPLPMALKVHNVFCDLNGETYRADEYGFAALRSKERFLDASDFVAPADCWGDVGAASAPLHLTMGLICHRKRYGKGPVSMAWASSESGERGAAVINSLDPMEGV